ncbi:MAG: DegV family protein [Anaerolineae bacterium]
MQIVTDRAADLSREQAEGLEIHMVPLTFTLDGKTYRSGVDIDAEGFYRLLNATSSFPTTSQPSAGEFAELYRRLAATDPEILSIHISSGLSGTISSAQTAAQSVPEARVTIYDTKTLSGAEGWHVEAAARAAKAGWDAARTLPLLRRISQATNTVYTLQTLSYLIHGGRISHLKGLMASLLNIKPLIGVDTVSGKYTQAGQARTLSRAILALAEYITRKHKPGSALRVQVLHGANPEGAATLQQRLAELFDCTFLPFGPIAPVLGAHTGPGLVGVAFGPAEAYASIPGDPFVR